MESNDSRLLNVPKKEFVRVIRGIIDQSTEAVKTGESFPGEASGNNLDALAVERQKLINATPRSAAVMRAMEKENELRLRRGGGIKRDSFYFLQLTLERREREKLAMKSGRQSDYNPQSMERLYKDDSSDNEFRMKA